MDVVRFTLAGLLFHAACLSIPKNNITLNIIANYLASMRVPKVFFKKRT
jgi:hypothetical protein